MSSECVEIREMAAMIVRDYLTGPWKKVTPNNIIVQRVNGGLSNWLYQISLPTMYQNQNENSDPKTVLLRFHGQVHSESAFEHIITESVIFTLLSERRLGPRLHGVFPGGRIEEFIQARPLKTNELWDPKISLAVATKMAQVHSLHVPISKKEKYMFDLMNKWLTQAEDDLEQYEPNDVETQKLLEKFKSYDLHSEIAWLRHYLPTVNSPVVFCHNDMQEGNILISNDSINSKQPNLVLIDYEYCSYNYRGFDFANHFLEYTINYSKKEYPNFVMDPSAYPSIEHQVKFIRQYLDVYNSLQLINKADRPSANVNQGLDYNHYSDSYYNANDLGSGITGAEAQLLKEISNFRLLSHLLWGIWAAMHSQSTIEFGYWEYCIARLEAYFQTKKEILTFEVPGSKRKKP